MPSGLRLTASDRPGVAQPVPVRDVPPRPWGRIALVALLLAALLTGAWEARWRAFGVTPTYANSEGLWAMQRRRIDHGEGNATVIVGASRLLFDVQLSTWEQATGQRPIQLAMEGTSPMAVIEDLAADPDFTGRLLVGVDPDQFFTGFENRSGLVAYYRHEGPSQRTGQWLSMRLVEPWLAFDDPDFALATVVRRWPWPPRAGVRSLMPVRKLALRDAERNTTMWAKAVHDPAYNALARRTWSQRFNLPPRPGTPPPPVLATAQIERAARAVAVLRARGVVVVFVRPPSGGPFLASESRRFPRSATWDALLARTGAPGIHFQDHPSLQGGTLPEWSHLDAASARQFTAALAPLAQSAFIADDARRERIKAEPERESR